MFPNPSNGELNIAYGDTPGRATIGVIDMAGRTIHFEMMNMTNGSRGAVNLRDRLITGTYTLRITTAAGSDCQRVVVPLIQTVHPWEAAPRATFRHRDIVHRG